MTTEEVQQMLMDEMDDLRGSIERDLAEFKAQLMVGIETHASSEEE